MRKKILIVEDDEAIRDALGELLEMEDFEIVKANNGQEALDILRSQPLPQLILLDLMMPVKDGFQFRTEQLADQKISTIPVIIMSADAHISQKAARMGGVNFLKKPPDLEEVISMVNRCAT